MVFSPLPVCSLLILYWFFVLLYKLIQPLALSGFFVFQKMFLYHIFRLVPVNAGSFPKLLFVYGGTTQRPAVI